MTNLHANTDDDYDDDFSNFYDDDDPMDLDPEDPEEEMDILDQLS